jgi:chorismate mutase
MAEVPRYRATPKPKFLTTAWQIPRTIWRAAGTGISKIRLNARRFGRWLKLKTARPVLAADKGVRRGGRRLWRWISAAPNDLYRGMGYIARLGTAVVRTTFGAIVVTSLVAALGVVAIGVVAAKVDDAWNNRVHQPTVAWSRGARLPQTPRVPLKDDQTVPGEVVDADAPDYTKDEVQDEADEAIEKISEATGLSVTSIVDLLRKEIGSTPEVLRSGTREDADAYPILERQVMDSVTNKLVWQELRYDDIDTAIRDQETRAELYMALSQMDANVVRERWEMMKEVARIRDDTDRASYYAGREAAVGQFISASPQGDILTKFTPHQMADTLSVANADMARLGIVTNELTFRNGVRHEWARLRDQARASKNAAQQREQGRQDREA